MQALNAAKLKTHLQSFLQGDRAKRSKSQLRGGRSEDAEDANGVASDTDRRSRATTPSTGRARLEEVSLRPVGERRPPRDSPAIAGAAGGAAEDSCELKNHFRDFMRTPALVKRGRSFSQPRDKAGGGAAGAASGSEVEPEAGGATPTTSLSRKESLNDRTQMLEGERRRQQQQHELANHTKRFLKRKSMINPNKLSDDSDNDASVNVVVSREKTLDKCATDLTYSDNDLDNSNTSDSRQTSQHSSPVVVTSKKPPLFKTTTTTAEPRQRPRAHKEDDEKPLSSRLKAVQRPDRRTRSKSDITVPRVYAETNGLAAAEGGDDEAESTQSETLGRGGALPETETPAVGEESREWEQHDEVVEHVEAQITQPWLEMSTSETSEVLPMPRIRKNNLNSGSGGGGGGGGEYVYVSAATRVANARPKPFVAQTTSATSSSGQRYEESSRQNSSGASTMSGEGKGSGDALANSGEMANGGGPVSSAGYSNSTTELMNACKSGLRRLTYRKTYSRSRSGTTEPAESCSQDDNNNNNDHSRKNYTSSLDSGGSSREVDSLAAKLSSSSITYTQHSSGSRLPNRPTTPGPYLGMDPHATAGLYKRPTTPGPFSRHSWKRTNQKFNYAKFLNYSNHETYV